MQFNSNKLKETCIYCKSDIDINLIYLCTIVNMVCPLRFYGADCCYNYPTTGYKNSKCYKKIL